MQAASLSTKTVFDMEKNAIVRSRLQLVEAMMRERNAAGAAKLAARIRARSAARRKRNRREGGRAGRRPGRHAAGQSAERVVERGAHALPRAAAADGARGDQIVDRVSRQVEERRAANWAKPPAAADVRAAKPAAARDDDDDGPLPPGARPWLALKDGKAGPGLICSSAEELSREPRPSSTWRAPREERDPRGEPQDWRALGRRASTNRAVRRARVGERRARGRADDDDEAGGGGARDRRPPARRGAAARAARRFRRWNGWRDARGRRSAARPTCSTRRRSSCSVPSAARRGARMRSRAAPSASPNAPPPSAPPPTRTPPRLPLALELLRLPPSEHWLGSWADAPRERRPPPPPPRYVANDDDDFAPLAGWLPAWPAGA